MILTNVIPDEGVHLVLEVLLVDGGVPMFVQELAEHLNALLASLCDLVTIPETKVLKERLHMDPSRRKVEGINLGVIVS